MIDDIAGMMTFPANLKSLYIQLEDESVHCFSNCQMCFQIKYSYLKMSKCASTRSILLCFHQSEQFNNKTSENCESLE